MAQFLRVIRQARWLSQDWLPSGELPGDTLLDVQTRDNALSVYQVDDAVDKDRVALALAANRDHVNVIDYLIFDDAGFPSMRITSERRPGDTPDEQVNELHYELENLTVSKLAQLTRILSDYEPVRIPLPRVRSRLREAVTVGSLDRTRLKLSLLRDLNEASTIRELDRVVLAVDVPDHTLRQSDIGTVVWVHGLQGHDVEFLTLEGHRLVVVALTPREVRAIGGIREIAHVRSF